MKVIYLKDKDKIIPYKVSLRAISYLKEIWQAKSLA